jgi:MYXO-CTERM domain-containing protein
VVGIGTLGQSTSEKTFALSVNGKHPAVSIYLRKNSSLVPGLAEARLGGLNLATSGGKTSGGGRAAKDLLLNAPIGASRNFPGGGGTFLNKHTSSGPLKGFFGGQKTGFVGFSYAGLYGWIEVMVSDAGSPGYTNELKAIAYAYNSVAGATINAGQGIPTSTPEPDTAALGLLASGAAGLAIWRRRRKEVDAPGV